MSGESDGYIPSKYLKQLRDRIYPELAFSAANADEFVDWRRKLKKRLSELLGGFPGQRCQLNPRVVEQVEVGCCIREKVVIDSDDGCLVPMYVFVPRKGERPFAPIIAVHGHGRGMRDTAGVWLTDEERQAGTETRHDYGRRFAERGYMVFAPEMIGFGERREDEDKLGASDRHSCRTLSWHAAIIGKTAIGLRVWDVIRVIDYAETRVECDAKKGVGCVGLSGGGTVTLYSSALDERIRCAIVSGYFNTFEDSILAMEHCDCNYIPGIRRYAEMPDVAAMIAPRPLLVESGTMDGIFPIDAAKAAYKRLAKAYHVLNAGDRLDMDIGEGGHRFYGNKAFDWMGKWLAARK